MPRILTTEESLLNYAAWYAMRYFPSLRKLREALMKKSEKNESLVEAVMKEMNQYISEERTVDGLVRIYVEQSKTRPYIEQKLKLKKFGEDTIMATLDAYQESFISWPAYEQVINRKMTDYLGKNKSRKYITGTLVQKYPIFKNEITALMDRLSSDEIGAVQAEFEKLSGKHDMANQKERQRVIQKLCTKGFSFNLIKKVMRDDDE